MGERTEETDAINVLFFSEIEKDLKTEERIGNILKTMHEKIFAMKLVYNTTIQRPDALEISKDSTILDNFIKTLEQIMHIVKNKEKELYEVLRTKKLVLHNSMTQITNLAEEFHTEVNNIKSYESLVSELEKNIKKSESIAKLEKIFLELEEAYNILSKIIQEITARGIELKQTYGLAA